MLARSRLNGKLTGHMTILNPPPGGQFKRQTSSFRDCISKDGKFPPEAGRYTLVVSLACPWAHRALIVRDLKGLDKVMGMSESVAYIFHTAR